MKRKNDKGAITIFVLLSGLFFVAFLTSMLMIVAVKRQTQAGATKQTENIYSEKDAETIYNSYFGDETVPIYTEAQLKKVGSGDLIPINEEGGKYYVFSDKSIYVLKNDISFEHSGVWTMPELDSDNGGRIEWQGKTLTIKNVDPNNNEETYYYYNDSNNYAFPVTKEGYSYLGLSLFYDGINNTGKGHSLSTTTWKDLSGNGNNGKITGGTWDSESVTITGINKNTTGIKTVQNFPINTTNETISIVFELKDINVLSGRIPILGSGTSASDELLLFNNHSTTLDYIRLRIWTNGSSTYKDLGPTIEYKKTVSVTLVFLNNRLNVYMDGELINTVDVTSVSKNLPLYILNAASEKGTTGSVYGVKIYDRAITEEEVKLNYEIDKIRYIQKSDPVYAIIYSNNDDNTDLEMVFNNTGNVDTSRTLIFKSDNVGMSYYAASTDRPWNSYVENINTLTFETKVQPFCMRYFFYGFKNLTVINNIKNLDMSKVRNTYCMFHSCTGLTTLDVSNFDTSSISSSMAYMFYNCSGLTELDVSGFDTSNATSMSNMFYNCRGLTELDVSGFDTSNVTSMASMFYNCRGLSKLDVSDFDTKKVTNMSGMFYYCNGLTELDVSGFNTSKVTNMTSMFYYCSGLTELDVSGFNTSNVTNMATMFRGCSKLTELDLSGFTSPLTTTFSGMFYGCSALTELNLKGIELGTEVTTTSNMFRGCSKLKTIYVSDSWTLPEGATSDNMFTGCSKLVGGNGTTYLSTNVDATYACIDTESKSGYFTEYVVNPNT